MNMLRLRATVTIICAVSMLSGCYSPDRFRSDSADILVAWGNPKYCIVFRQTELLAQTNDFVFEFSNPPRIKLALYLLFPTQEDIERLTSRNARLTVSVTDSGGGTAFEVHVAAIELRTPINPGLFVLPPDGWCSGPKGNVVRDTYVWRQQDHASGQDVWTYAVPHMGLMRVGDMTLGSKDYMLRITVTLDDADELPTSFHVILSGGWYATL